MSRAVDEHLFKRQGANKNSAEEKGFCPKKIIVARWPQWPAVLQPRSPSLYRQSRNVPFDCFECLRMHAVLPTSRFQLFRVRIFFAFDHV